jgi:hypothetical protein
LPRGGFPQGATIQQQAKALKQLCFGKIASHMKKNTQHTISLPAKVFPFGHNIYVIG